MSTTELLLLKQQLEKLKDKEAKLEADLAIREHPEVEEAVYDIVTVLARIRKMEKQLKTLQPKVDIRRADIASKQLDFYKNKLEEIKDRVEPEMRQLQKFYLSKMAAITGGDKKTSSYKVSYDVMHGRLKTLYLELVESYARWKMTLDAYHFDLEYFLPSVVDYLKRAETI